jgi:hypothetical protein
MPQRRSADIRPQRCRSETGQMTNICCSNHDIRYPKRDDLGRQNHIAVYGLVISGRLTLLTGLRPEHRRLMPRRRADREICQKSRERIQPRQPTDLVGTQSLRPHVSVGHLRHHDTGLMRHESLYPWRTSNALPRTSRVGRDAQWPRIDPHHVAHHVTSFSSGGNSLRSARRCSSRARTRYSPVSRCSSM